MRRWEVGVGIIVLLIIGGCTRSAPPTDVRDETYTEIVVDFEDDVTEAEIEAIEQALGIDLGYNSIHAREEVVTIARVPTRLLPQLLKELRDRGDVEYAEENATYHTFDFTPNDPHFPKQWHLTAIGMPKAWEHAHGKGVTVAVIDTGVAYEDYREFRKAPDLAGTTFVPGYDFVNDTEHANDDHSHGTHVAGTIAQSTDNGLGVAGVAYEASIMPLKVLAASGGGTVSDIADAIRFAADHGARVINMSLGGGPRSEVMGSAVRYARKKGVVVVCAAGNGGRPKVEYPAAYPESVAVSSTGPSGQLAFYSSYGPEVRIAGPGGDKSRSEEDGVLQQTISQHDPAEFVYAYYQGTSMAAPHVAGAVALIMSAGATDADRAEEILFASAQHAGDKNRDEKYGYGRLDAAAAVALAQQEKTGGGCGAAAPSIAGSTDSFPSRGVLTAILIMVFMMSIRMTQRKVPFGILQSPLGILLGLSVAGPLFIAHSLIVGTIVSLAATAIFGLTRLRAFVLSATLSTLATLIHHFATVGTGGFFSTLEFFGNIGVLLICACATTQRRED